MNSLSMHRTWKFLVIGLVLCAELIFLLFHNPWPHGKIVDVRYRLHERMEARRIYFTYPSSASKAAFDAELKRLDNYVRWQTLGKLGLLAALNGIAIYCFLKSGSREKANKPSG